MNTPDSISSITTPASEPASSTSSVFTKAAPSAANVFNRTLENTKVYLLAQAEKLPPEHAIPIQNILSNATQIKETKEIQEAVAHILLAWQAQYPNATPELIESARNTLPIHQDRLEHIEQQMAQSHQKATPTPEGE